MKATVRVPATVANLGPGFDILALALQLQNEVVGESRDGAGVTIEVDSPERGLRDPARNLVARAYIEACVRLGVEPAARGVHLRCINAVPFSRGLGSSAAAALSGVLVAAALHRAPWETRDIVDCVALFEGHPDNAAAALLGGLVICAPGADPAHVDLPDEMQAVVFAPRARLPTAEARTVVAATFDRADAIFNASRCALLVRAVLMRDYGSLRTAMEDRWHQQQRVPLFPPMAALIAAAYEAGADGACLAGAGPSILALSAHGTGAIADAFRETADRLGVAGEVLVLPTRNFGARVDVHA